MGTLFKIPAISEDSGLCTLKVVLPSHLKATFTQEEENGR